MYADVEKTCVGCRQAFWWTAGEQEFFNEKELAPPKRCKECRAARRNAANAPIPQIQPEQALIPVSTNAVHRRRSKSAVSDLPTVPALIANKKALFADLEQILMDATAPVVHRRRTFFEWVGGVDPVAKQLAQKMELARTADEMVQQRAALFEHMRQMLVAATNAELTRIEAQIKLRQAELQMLQLEQEIEKRQALQSDSIRTLKAEQVSMQTRLLPQVKPQEPSEEKALSEHRRKVRTKATAKQLLISDFLKELQRVFRANVGEAEKAMRIRAVLQTYGQEPDDLPREIREFLERVENEAVNRGW